MDRTPETKQVPVALAAEGRLPVYSSPGAAGADVFAAADAVLLPQQTLLIQTGLAVAVPEGCELQVRPRSGLSLRTSLRVANSPGTVDSDYRDELAVVATNTAGLLDWPAALLHDPQAASLAATGKTVTLGHFLAERGLRLTVSPAFLELPLFLDRQGNPYGTIYIKAGERVAQLVLTRFVRADFQAVTDVRGIGRDRGGGFGSTGR